MPRNFVAHPEQFALFSPRVVDGERPRWAYREEPADDLDSGWRFFEGGESVEWLNDPDNYFYSTSDMGSTSFPSCVGLFATTLSVRVAMEPALASLQ